MDQPHPNAALGSEPIRTIGRDELKAKLDRGDDFRLILVGRGDGETGFGGGGRPPASSGS